MAAVFPVSVKSSRKQWTLHNGIKGPIKSFCTEVAEDGFPDAQVVLAKELLYKNTDQDADAEENARLGVYWLIKASEQGHVEATSILRHCLETGRGMTEHNFLDVKACLAMSREEKLARRAAKEVFTRLSSGEDFISSDQLQDRMKQLEAKPSTSAGKESPHEDDKSKASVSADWKERCNTGGEKLTEDMLVSAASSYSRGQLPLVQRSLSLDNQSDLRRNFLCSVILLPFSAIHSSCREIINTIGRHSYRHIWPIVIANIQAAIMVSLFLFFGLDGMISMLPTAIYFGSLIVMVVTTCQALSRKQDFHLFRRWSNLFIAYSNGQMDSGDAEYQYCRNNTQPIVVFFVALIVHLLMTPSFLPHVSSPQSEITVVAFIFTFLTLYNFTISPSRQGAGAKKSPDLLALFSFGVHVLAKYPYETDTVVSRGWRFIDVQVPTFASYIVGNGVEFCLNFRALFYLVIPAILVKMAVRDNLKGIYLSLVPHCMVLAWWQVAVLASQGATWYGLIRSALALVGFVLFLPLAGLASVLVPLLAVGKFLVETDEFKDIIITASIASVPVLLAFYVRRKRSREAKSYLGWIQFLLLMVAGALFVWPAVHLQKASPYPTLKGMPSTVTWTQYREYCSGSAASAVPTSVVSMQLRCAGLAGQPVKWDGRVGATRLVRVHNPVARLVSRLPFFIQSILNCWLGEKFDVEDCHKVKEPDCGTPPELTDRCHLTNWNRYEFELDILMTSGLWRGGEFQVTLTADNTFKNFTTSLVEGDHVWFAGLITGDSSGILSSDSAWIDLKEIGCLICKDERLKAAKRSPVFTFSSIYSGFKGVLNFLFNPIVIFR